MGSPLLGDESEPEAFLSPKLMGAWYCGAQDSEGSGKSESKAFVEPKIERSLYSLYFWVSKVVWGVRELGN